MDFSNTKLYYASTYMIKPMNHNSLSCEHKIGLDV